MEAGLWTSRSSGCWVLLVEGAWAGATRRECSYRIAMDILRLR